MPLVSVVIPVYKTENYLPRCIDSLLAQTLQDLEIILVDDASPDNCGKICDEYAATHSNIHVIHKENGGPQLARIAGMKVAQGKYLAFVDSDDWVMPEMFAPMVREAEAHEADIVAAGFTRDFGTRIEACSNQIPSGVYTQETLAWLRDNAVFDTDAMCQAYAPCVWNKIFRTDTMLDILLECDDKLTFGEDALHTFATLFRSKCVVVMNENQQYRYPLREGSTTNSYYKNYLADLFIVYDRLTELAEPVKTEKLTDAIAYNYIFLYWMGISQELGNANPAGWIQKYRRICQISRDARLGKCLVRVDLSKYSKPTALSLRLLAAGQPFPFFLIRLMGRLKNKTSKLLKKVTG